MTKKKFSPAFINGKGLEGLSTDAELSHFKTKQSLYIILESTHGIMLGKPGSS